MQKIMAHSSPVVLPGPSRFARFAKSSPFIATDSARTEFVLASECRLAVSFERRRKRASVRTTENSTVCSIALCTETSEYGS